MSRSRSGRVARRGGVVALALVLAAPARSAEPPPPGDGVTEGDAFRIACLRGEGEGCFQYARWLAERPSARADAGRIAATYYWGACKRGVVKACARAGKLHLGNGGIPANLRWARFILREGCKLGDEESCDARHDERLEAIEDPPKDPRTAEKACTAGKSVSACVVGGRAFVAGEGVARDDERGVALLRKACDAGEPRGCAYLGFARSNSLFLERACLDSIYLACARAASLMHPGFGRGDPVRAATLNELGCVGGVGEACIALADQTRLGDGVPRGEAQALRILEAACRFNSPRACGERGAREKDAESREYLGRGCDGGDPDSCVFLAHTYRAQDPRKMRLYLKACRDLRDRGACVLGAVSCGFGHLQGPECNELEARSRPQTRAP